jgi:hypothetical protein
MQTTPATPPTTATSTTLTTATSASAGTVADAATAAAGGGGAHERSRELLLQGLVGVEVLLDQGRRTAAAAALRTLLDRADPALSGEIIEHAAVRQLARQAAVALPRTSTGRTDRYVPAGRVTCRRGAPRAADPGRREGDAAAVAYLAEQGPAPVESSGWNEPVWGDLDYDLAAVAGLRGTPCLGCRLERTASDLANPDGLCVDCRDCGGLTRERVIQRCCALVAERNTGTRAVELLRRAWRRATRPGDRAVIAAWVAQHEDLVAAAPTS